MEPIDFLSRGSDATMRTHIRNILDSYSHYWDILAELCQNAVDALIERLDGGTKFQPRIKIEIDCRARAVRVSDNGIGVEANWLGLGPDKNHPTIINPDSTQKLKSKRKLVGSKGVGLTFVAFSCNEFIVTTRRQGDKDAGPVRVRCMKASRWQRDLHQGRPCIEPEPLDAIPGDWSTIVDARDISRYETGDEGGRDLFELTRERFAYLLRSRTALGWTHQLFKDMRTGAGELFSESIAPEIEFIYTDANGDKKEPKILPSRYETPAELFSQHTKRTTIDSEEFLRRVAAKDRSVPGKLVSFTKLFQSTGGRHVAAYALAVPGTHVWSELVKNSHLSWPEDSFDSADIRPGIWLATKGMPCGVQVGTPPGLPGWSSAVFMLLEDAEMTFDLGRKGPRGRAPAMYQDVARQLFNEMRNVRVFEHLRDRPARPWTKGGKLTQIGKLTSLSSLPAAVQESTAFVHSPDRQEAAVAGMFFHLVGKGKLKGYRFLRTSYHDEYDVVIRFSLKEESIAGASGVAYDPGDIVDGVFTEDIIAEFKYKAESIIFDINKDRKRFEDFKILICWTLDKREFEKNGIKVFQLDDDRRLYSGCQYQLDFHDMIGRDDPRLIMCLSEMLAVDSARFP